MIMYKFSGIVDIILVLVFTALFSHILKPSLYQSIMAFQVLGTQNSYPVCSYVAS